MELIAPSTSALRGRRSLVLRRERGVVLFVALIILIAMTLAGLALMRQMGSGTSIAGNVAFKESATSVSDRGIEVARNWITTPLQDLNDDAFAVGYHSTWVGSVDPTTYLWDTEALQVAAPDDDASTGNTTYVMIHRLCQLAGVSANAPGQQCSDSVDASGGGGSKGGGGYGSGPPPKPLASPYFRVTTRVVGPRQTVSYTQVLMQ